jgi:hypothetical protein
MAKNPLDPTEAENIAKNLRAEHGLGQKYRITVERSQDRWLVYDCKGHVDSVPPMNESRWREYLQQRFVEAITEHAETSEA